MILAVLPNHIAIVPNHHSGVPQRTTVGYIAFEDGGHNDHVVFQGPPLASLGRRPGFCALGKFGPRQFLAGAEGKWHCPRLLKAEHVAAGCRGTLDKFLVLVLQSLVLLLDRGVRWLDDAILRHAKSHHPWRATIWSGLKLGERDVKVVSLGNGGGRLGHLELLDELALVQAEEDLLDSCALSLRHVRIQNPLHRVQFARGRIELVGRNR
mmetsp:Transcript_7270/g.18663  ORF Transcript_7270/g.18663 Transcript_7270/m.18663 type:complete len:210 (+) Transcript_7270:637-1266(+)